MGSVFSRLNRAHAGSPGQGGAGRQPRTSALVLEYWSRHPRSPEGERVGSESYRPTGRRSAQSISRNDRLLPRNLKYMRTFAEAWPDEQIVQQVAAQIPWFHNCVILDSVKSPAEREWYIRATIQNGWSPMFWFTRSRAACIAAKARRSRISPAPCRLVNRSSRSRS